MSINTCGIQWSLLQSDDHKDKEEQKDRGKYHRDNRCKSLWCTFVCVCVCVCVCLCVCT